MTRGEWKLSGINEAMRLNRYSAKNKERFGFHRDAPFCPNGDKRSLYTVLVYLNDDFREGETRFYIPKDDTIDTKGCTVSEEMHRINITSGYTCIKFSPVAGDVLIFKQNLLYQGTSLKGVDGYKFIVKTDIMVERPVNEKFGFSLSLSLLLANEKITTDVFSCFGKHKISSC